MTTGDTIDEQEAAEVVKTCSSCAWSRADDGTLYSGQDRAYCVQPELSQGDGTGMPCEKQRLAPSSNFMIKVCGFEGIFWEPRE